MFKQIKTNSTRCIAPITMAAAILCALSSAQAATTNNNFTMFNPGGNTPGNPFGGTNDVTFTWDGTFNTDPATAVTNATLASATPTKFNGFYWIAYNVKIYGPGTYTISTADTEGPGGGCPYDPAIYTGAVGIGPGCATGGNYTVTVPAGHIMGHMKFAWNVAQGIDVINIWRPGDWTSLNAGFAIWTSAGGTYAGPAYDLVSVDGDCDSASNGTEFTEGTPGCAMLDGPFIGYGANFSINWPLAFTFTDQSDVALSTTITSNAVAVTAVTNAAISVSGAASSQYAISTDGGLTYGAWTSTAGTVSNGSLVKVRHTSAASNAIATNTVLTIGSVSDTFTSTTPGSVGLFSFTDQSNVALGTAVESNAITVTGISSPVAISVTGTGGEYAISTDGGTTYSTYTSSAGTVANNNRVKVRHTSASTVSTAVSTELDVGGITDTFTSTTTATSGDAAVRVPTAATASEPALPGCSISTTPISVMTRADWWLVAGFLAWLGALRMRFRRQTQS